MRHRIRGRKLGRTTAHRKALFRNQLSALFTHERIITTVAKAKELRPLAERMVSLAGTGTLPARRKVLTMVPDKDVVRRLFDEIAPRFTERPGGYTRIMRLGRRRGDGAELAIIEFVDYDLADHEEGASSTKGQKGSLMDRAKGMFGGGAKAAADEVDEETAAAEDAVDETAEAAAEAVEPGEPAEEPVEVAPEEEPEPVAEAAEPEEPAQVVDEPVAEEEPVAEAEAVEAEEPVEAAEPEVEAEPEATDEAAEPEKEKKED
jgi:large subunit ribosomal protein L17